MAARIREIKIAKLTEATSSDRTLDIASGMTISAASEASTSSVSEPSTSAAPEPSTSTAPSENDDEDRPTRTDADCENERPDYSSSEEEFDPQDFFDDWVTSLRLHV